METLSHYLDRPEYVHNVLNHFPLVGLLVALAVLGVGVVTRSRPILLTGLTLTCLLALSAWPVYHFGEEGFDRVLSMADEAGEAYLKYHAALAHRWVFLFYLTSAVAAIGLGLAWKWPRWLVPTAIAALILGLASLAAGTVIARAGGQVRHREFRSGPPPKVPDENSDSQ